MRYIYKRCSVPRKDKGKGVVYVGAPEKSKEERAKILERVLALHDNTSAGRRFGLVVGGSLLDLIQTKFEDLGDVYVSLRARLNKSSFIVFG